MRALALIVSYVGTEFAGFAVQPGARTVQSCLSEALGALAGSPVAVRGAGRTDAGVHAAGQVVDLRLPDRVRVPTARLPLALARLLPADLAVRAAHEVRGDFHARLDAESKRYRYVIWRPPVASPFWRAYAWHYSGGLDVPAMNAAAALLVGRHDCRCFAGAARPVYDATRTIVHSSVREGGPWLAIEVEADGFLYRMVRAIAGTLLAVGRGALTPAQVADLLRGRPRGQAGPSLPARGLCLLWARYPPGLGVPTPDPGRWPAPPGLEPLDCAGGGR